MKRNMKCALAVVLAFSVISFGSISASMASTGGATNVPSGATPIKLSTTIKKMELTTVPNGMGVQAMADYVAKKSGGKLAIQMYLDGVLGSTTDEIIGGAQNGAFDMVALSFGNWGDYTKAFMPIDIPYLFFSEKAIYKFVDGKIGKKMKEQVEKDTGMVVLAMLDVGFRNITSNREIKKPSDMKGLKIRTQTDRYQMAAMKALGASPIAISFAELYSSLQQKLVDAQENPIINTYTSKLYEVQKYMTLSKHVYTFTVLAISKAKLNSLPPEQQKIIRDGGRVAELTARKQLGIKEKEILGKLKKVMKIYKPTTAEQEDFQNIAKTSWSLIEKDMGKTYFDEVVSEAAKDNKSK